MPDQRMKLTYAKGRAPSIWEIVPRAAFAAVLFIFPLLDFFVRETRNAPLLLLDVGLLLIGAVFLFGIVRLYWK
jgi:hypothetical protein